MGRPVVWMVVLVSALVTAACGSSDGVVATTTSRVADGRRIAALVAADARAVDGALEATRGPCGAAQSPRALPACKGPELVAVAAAQKLLDRIAVQPDVPALHDALATLSRGLQAFVSGARERIAAIDAGDVARFTRAHEAIAGALAILCPAISTLNVAVGEADRVDASSCRDAAVG